MVLLLLPLLLQFQSLLLLLKGFLKYLKCALFAQLLHSNSLQLLLDISLLLLIHFLSVFFMVLFGLFYKLLLSINLFSKTLSVKKSLLLPPLVLLLLPADLVVNHCKIIVELIDELLSVFKFPVFSLQNLRSQLLIGLGAIDASLEISELIAFRNYLPFFNFLHSSFFLLILDLALNLS